MARSCFFTSVLQYNWAFDFVTNVTLTSGKRTFRVLRFSLNLCFWVGLDSVCFLSSKCATVFDSLPFFFEGHPKSPEQCHFHYCIIPVYFTPVWGAFCSRSIVLLIIILAWIEILSIALAVNFDIWFILRKVLMLWTVSDKQLSDENDIMMKLKYIQI